MKEKWSEKREAAKSGTGIVKTALRLGCIAIGGIWLGWQTLSLAGQGFKRLLEDRKTVAVLLSPDQKHVATVVLTIGSSGAPATWCEVAVFVKAVGTAGERSRETGDLAYTADCDPSDEKSPTEVVRWVSPLVLDIAFLPNAVGRAELRNWVVNGQIRVNYTVRTG